MSEKEKMEVRYTSTKISEITEEVIIQLGNIVFIFKPVNHNSLQVGKQEVRDKDLPLDVKTSIPGVKPHFENHLLLF